MSAARLGYEGDLPDPYAGYFNSGVAGLSGAGEIDPQLSAKALVIRVALGENIMAYPLESIREERIILDQLGDSTISIVWDEIYQTARVFLGDVSEEVSSSGIDISESQTMVPSRVLYWFAWAGLFPESSVYQPR